MSKIRISLDEEGLEELIWSCLDIEAFMLRFNGTYVPHYSHIERVGIGAVQIHSNTSEWILNKLKTKYPDNIIPPTDAMMWINYSPSTADTTVPEWVIQIDFDRLTYKKV